MRTTLTLDDDIFRVVRSLAEESRQSMGKILSTLARKGLEGRYEKPDDMGIPVFSVSEKAPLFGPEEVAVAEDDL